MHFTTKPLLALFAVTLCASLCTSGAAHAQQTIHSRGHSHAPVATPAEGLYFLQDTIQFGDVPAGLGLLRKLTLVNDRDDTVYVTDGNGSDYLEAIAMVLEDSSFYGYYIIPPHSMQEVFTIFEFDYIDQQIAHGAAGRFVDQHDGSWLAEDAALFTAYGNPVQVGNGVWDTPNAETPVYPNQNSVLWLRYDGLSEPTQSVTYRNTTGSAIHIDSLYLWSGSYAKIESITVGDSNATIPLDLAPGDALKVTFGYMPEDSSIGYYDELVLSTSGDANFAGMAMLQPQVPDEPSSVRAEKKVNALTVYPNPVTSEIHVNASLGSQVTVSDALGRVRMEERGIQTELRLSVGHLVPGTYFVQVREPGGVTRSGRFTRE